MLSGWISLYRLPQDLGRFPCAWHDKPIKTSAASHMEYQHGSSSPVLFSARLGNGSKRVFDMVQYRMHMARSEIKGNIANPRLHVSGNWPLASLMPAPKLVGRQTTSRPAILGPPD